jgi:colicin import membrane protein
MAQGEKRENSVLFSLRELRQIEESRVQEEDAAVRTADEQRRQAAEDAERRIREAEEAKIREERDHQRSIEEARLGAEREARMRVESTEAAERQRHQAALEQQRLAQEMELRRAEVAKKRPTWMLVVTGIALVAAVALIFFAIQKMNQSAEDNKLKEEAQKIAEKAAADAKEAQERVAKLSNDLIDLGHRVDQATDALASAQNDADRQSARSKLDQLRKERAEMEQHIADAKAAAAKAERAKGVHVSKECLDNPLAKGCS